MHYLLTYHYTDDYLEKRGQFRNDHLCHAWAAQQRGELILGGVAGDPPNCAVLVFDCECADSIEQFIKEDPYFFHGLVDSYTIEPWVTVVGDKAHTPIYPASEDAQAPSMSLR